MVPKKSRQTQRKGRTPAKADPVFAAIAAYEKAYQALAKADEADERLTERHPADVFTFKPFALNEGPVLINPAHIVQHVKESMRMVHSSFGPKFARRIERLAPTARAEIRQMYDAHRAAWQKRRDEAGLTAARKRLMDAHAAAHRAERKLIRTVPTTHEGVLALLVKIRTANEGDDGFELLWNEGVRKCLQTALERMIPAPETRA